MSNIKKNPRQNKGIVAKTTRKKMVGKAASKHICDKITTKVFEKYQSWEQKKHGKKNGGVWAKKGSKW